MNEMKKKKVVISGGGTGGHIFPAIAIADTLKKRFTDVEILFVGANNRMEMERVPAAGYPIIGLDVAGFYRKKLWKNFSVLIKLRKSLKRAKKVLKEFNPDITIGVGGYASGPTLKQANSLGIPTLLQEQNSYAGVTNKLLAKGATTICVAYEGLEKFFPADKIVVTGNPCRQNLLNENISRDDAAKFFNIDPNKKTVLVIGGSLGAKSINQAMFAGLDKFTQNDIQVIWQCGQSYYFDLNIEMKHKTETGTVRILDFIDRMDLAYKAADLVISRAGAGSISELALLGKPSILIPSPNVAEDHQTKNAMALVNLDAAALVTDDKAVEELAAKAVEILKSDDKLNSLSENIRKMAHPDAAEKIVDEIVKIIEKEKK